MASTPLASLLSQIHEVWHDKPEFLISKAFVEFLSQHVSETKHLTFGFFRELANREKVEDSDASTRVVQYFIDTHVIELRFEFIDEDDNTYPVELSAVADARRTGELLNPKTGEAEPDFETKLFVYFVPSAEALKLFSGQAR